MDENEDLFDVVGDYSKFDEKTLEKMLKEFQPKSEEQQMFLHHMSPGAMVEFDKAIKNEAIKWLETHKDEVRRNATPRTKVTWGNTNK